MGFGLLFLGYLTVFVLSLTLYGWVFRIVGCVLMILGLGKLRSFFPRYLYSQITAFLLLLTGIFEGISFALSQFGAEGVSVFSEQLLNVELLIRLVVVFVFNMLLMWETSLSAASVGLDKQRSAAITTMITVVLWAVVSVLGQSNIIPIGFGFILQLVWIIMSSVVLYGCYARICPEGEEEIKRKKTGIGFIDRFYEKLDEREERALKTTLDEIEKRKKNRSARKQHRGRK